MPSAVCISSASLTEWGIVITDNASYICMLVCEFELCYSQNGFGCLQCNGRDSWSLEDVHGSLPSLSHLQ